jgi:hypothetical protein
MENEKRHFTSSKHLKARTFFTSSINMEVLKDYMKDNPRGCTEVVRHFSPGTEESISDSVLWIETAIFDPQGEEPSRVRFLRLTRMLSLSPGSREYDKLVHLFARYGFIIIAEEK